MTKWSWSQTPGAVVVTNIEVDAAYARLTPTAKAARTASRAPLRRPEFARQFVFAESRRARAAKKKFVVYYARTWAPPTTDEYPLSEFADAHALGVVGAPWLTDLTPIRGARHVLVSACRRLADLRGLEGAETVGIYRCPGVADLAPLAGAREVTLFACDAVADLTPLAGCPRVFLVRCPAIASLEGLAGAARVRVFECAGVTDLGALARVPSVEVVSFGDVGGSRPPGWTVAARIRHERPPRRPRGDDTGPPANRQLERVKAEELRLE